MSRYKFPERNKVQYGQDFRILRGVPPFVEFTRDERFKTPGQRVKLVAPGYGDLTRPNSYGNGSIYVALKDLPEPLEEREGGMSKLEKFAFNNHCPKCGQEGAKVQWLPEGYTGQAGGGAHVVTPCDVMRRECQGCGYVWDELPLDARP